VKSGIWNWDPSRQWVAGKWTRSTRNRRQVEIPAFEEEEGRHGIGFGFNVVMQGAPEVVELEIDQIGAGVKKRIV